MTSGGGVVELARFRDAITRRLGLQFEDAKLGFLGEVLQRRLEALRQPAPAYVAALDAETDHGELAALAAELTVAETYFFRNREQFDALAEVVLPDRMRAAATRSLRILSAACATGEEAYSIAMTARGVLVDPAWTLAIRAVDINPAVLEKAGRGRYTAWALRETPPDARAKWFRADGREFLLQDCVRKAVCFEQRNLVADDAHLWAPDTYDVVFCRNVLMYFSPDQARGVIDRIRQALAPGGYLFLGHAETLRGLSEDFHLHHSHGAFYYQRKADAQTRAPVRAPRRAAVEVGIAGMAAPLDDAWVDVIREANERVRALATAGSARKARSHPTRRRDLGPALDLMRRERFEEALGWIRDAPAGRADDPDVLLLEAMLLTHRGECADAESVCRRLLQLDELNAGAHYALALCRESLGDRAGAVEHDRVAVYLDPGFAMPRLHLGLLANRAGDRAAARRELGQALVLLEREDPSRILLFGGGFNRSALVALCRSAMSANGGRR